jgi:hypothetical protein
VEANVPNGDGYWVVTSAGKVYAFGNARFYGDMSGKRLNTPIVGIIPSPDGKGYWLVGKDGGVFAFGSAGFSGSEGNLDLRSVVAGASFAGESATPEAIIGPLAHRAPAVRRGPRARKVLMEEKDLLAPKVRQERLVPAAHRALLALKAGGVPKGRRGLPAGKD